MVSKSRSRNELLYSCILDACMSILFVNYWSNRFSSSLNGRIGPSSRNPNYVHCWILNGHVIFEHTCLLGVRSQSHTTPTTTWNIGVRLRWVVRSCTSSTSANLQEAPVSFGQPINLKLSVICTSYYGVWKSHELYGHLFCIVFWEGGGQW